MSLLPIGRRVRDRRGRGRGAVASGALLLAVLTAFTGQTGSAFAAAAPPAATASPQAEPTAPAPAGPKAPPKADPKADHEAAVRALGQSDVAETCPAALAPHTTVNCTVEPYKTVSFALTLPQQKDVVLFQVLHSHWANSRLVAPDGTAVTCENLLGSGSADGAMRCYTGAAGTYKLEITDQYGTENSVSASYVPLLSSAACKAVGAADRKLGAPTVFHGSLAAGSAGDCYTLDLAANDVLRTYASTYRVQQAVVDATGKEICTTRGHEGDTLDCRLTGTAPFRMSVVQGSGAAEAYDVTAARLSKPEGCVVVEPQAFGVSPDLTSTARCRTLRVSAASFHSFRPVSATSAPYGGLFTGDGTALLGDCAQGACELAQGDHTWVVDPRSTDTGAFGMAFHSAKETRGCTATHDNGLVAGPATGTFGGPGQHLCLTLPTATGKGVYLLNRPPAEGTPAKAKVYDASGAPQCDSDGYSYRVCKLTGTAPFRAVLSGEASKAFALVIHRTEETAGCTAWRQTGFDGTWGAEASLSPEVRSVCLSVPANAHSTAEMLDYANLANSVNASVQLVDPAGTVACNTVGSSTTICPLAAGVSYTAMLLPSSWQPDTYKLVRRDVSATANCTVPASTKVGGPSTPFDLTSALDARCVRVTGAASDKFWLSSRTLGNPRYEPSTLLMAVDAQGKYVCRQAGVSCQVTGSTSYVAIVLASGYRDKPVHTDVDAWKAATAAGWAPECSGNRVSVDGFAVRSGVLSESSAAYCAVIDVKPGQSFDVVGNTSSTNGNHPSVNLLSATQWSSSYLGYQCTQYSGRFGGDCMATNNGEAGQALLMLSASKAATPVEYSIQGICRDGCTRPPTPLPTSVGPATGAAGTQTQAVVQGTGLTLGTKIKLSRLGSGSERFMTPLSVNADGTALTVLVDTNGLEPGKYDVIGDGVGYSTGVPSPGYLPNAYTVTAAAASAKSRFVPITPSRFLDTRDGVGAAKARVGPGGVVTLQVAGVKGVPATGVSAVVMNVTAVNPTEAGHVMVYPNGQPKPAVSNLNFAAGQIVPNLVTVPVVNGKVDLRNNAGSVDLIADVTGYFTDKAATGSAFTPITPSRFLDTRDGVGATKARVGPGGVVTLQVAGVKGVPASGVSAVVMNVTAVSPTEAGHVTVYPNGQAAPGVSNLNFTAGQVVPNLVTVPVVNGKVDLRNNSGSVDLIADVTGYYSADGSTFSAGSPVRLLDTRDGTGARAGAVGQGGIVSLKVAGVEGVPLTGVTAVVLNVTVTGPTQDGHLIVQPHGVARPNVSNLNFTAGRTVSNLVVVPVVDGRVTFYNNTGSADVIADLNGYFTS
ncbi:hypothetical protein [Streptomyces sp. NPDC048269]|uniref:hypothetical protein n=1 Tax=Streptomyces sp. NPDC048269 TaxID=3155753 RepID=UPI003443C460